MVSAGISEGIILVASVIVAASLSGVVLSKAGALNSAFTISSEAQQEATLTKIKIVYAIGTSSSPTVNVWVKNVGSTPVKNTDKVDVYFGAIGATTSVAYNATGNPKWVYNPSTVNVWQIKDTVRIDITMSSNLAASTTYMVKIVTPNGVTDEYIFST